VDVDKPFRFIPLDYTRDLDADPAASPRDAASAPGAERLTPEGAGNIVGIQGNLWGETLYADGRLDEMLLPKLFGLAERAWAPEPDWSREREAARATELYRAAWSSFATVVGTRELPRLTVDYPGVAYRIPTPGLSVTADGAIAANLQLPGFVLRYTTDGSEPTVTSAALTAPVRTAGTVTVAAFDSTGRRGASARLAPVGRQ
jgi:hexosaminidase